MFHIFELVIVTLTILGSEMMLLIGKIIEVYKISGLNRNFLQDIENKEELSIIEILETYSKNNIGSVIFGQLCILLFKIPRILVNLYVLIRRKLNPEFEISEKLRKIL